MLMKNVLNICSSIKTKHNTHILFYLFAGYIGAAQPYRSRMVENVRAILSQRHSKYFEQYGYKAAAMAEHDVYME